jgi:hypothetical protein
MHVPPPPTNCFKFHPFTSPDGHDAVGEVESFLNTVTMVNIDVDVEHACMVLEQFQDRHHDIVHVAKARRLTLLCVVQTTRPS